MTDRELILAAAKAAGKLPERWRENVYYIKGLLEGWHPLTDDGDALRLAVKCGVTIAQWHPSESVSAMHAPCNREFSEPHGNDPCAATRRAIVRAAAEIGRGMA